MVTEKNSVEQQRSVVRFYDFWFPRGRRKVVTRHRQMSTARRSALHTDHRSPYNLNFIQGWASVHPERYLHEEVFSYALICPNSRSVRPSHPKTQVFQVFRTIKRVELCTSCTSCTILKIVRNKKSHVDVDNRFSASTISGAPSTMSWREDCFQSVVEICVCFKNVLRKTSFGIKTPIVSFVILRKTLPTTTWAVSKWEKKSNNKYKMSTHKISSTQCVKISGIFF